MRSEDDNLASVEIDAGDGEGEKSISNQGKTEESTAVQ